MQEGGGKGLPEQRRQEDQTEGRKDKEKEDKGWMKIQKPGGGREEGKRVTGEAVLCPIHLPLEDPLHPPP